MLLQANEMRALVVLIDGVDEAAGLKEAIEEFVHKEVSVSGEPPGHLTLGPHTCRACAYRCVHASAEGCIHMRHVCMQSPVRMYIHGGHGPRHPVCAARPLVYLPYPAARAA